MKLAFYGLAAVLLAGLQAYLPFSGAAVKETRSPAVAQPVVFVDTAGLVHLHPGWQALKGMRSCLAEVRRASSGVSSHLATGSLRWESGPDEGAGSQAIRRDLEAEARRSATSALRQYESEMRQALWLRTESMRVGMMKSAQLGLAPDVREIEASAAAMISALEEKYSAGRLNAQLKVTVLQAALASPGVDPGAAEMKLHRAKSALSSIEESCNNDKDRVIDVVNAKISALREGQAATVDKLLESSEKDENQRISSRIDAAREKVIQELDSFEDWPRGATLAAFAGAPAGSVRTLSMEAAGDTTGAQSLARLNAAAAGLQQQIKMDVDRAVRSLARQNGVRVTFTRGEAGVPDETHTFTRLMRRRPWAGAGPVLSKARG